MADLSKDPFIEQRDVAIALSTELYKSSAQEYDKQTVYIAGGGLALTLTFAKDIIKIAGSHYMPLLVLTWIAFAAALISNLISQRKASEVHSLSRRLHLYLRDCDKPDATSIQIDEQRIYKERQEANLQIANKKVLGFNRASEWSIIVGIGAFILFGAINAYMTVKESAPTSATPTNSKNNTSANGMNKTHANNSVTTKSSTSLGETYKR